MGSYVHNVIRKYIVTKGNPRRNTPNRRCEECMRELEYLDENLDIAICSECMITYDLKIWQKEIERI